MLCLTIILTHYIILVDKQSKLETNMFQSFSVKNYKSIKDLLTIDFTSKNQIIKDEHKSLFAKLNGSTISRLNFFYGKNGSGKSTLKDALSSFVSLIMARGDDEEESFLLNKSRYRGGVNIIPFKLGESLDSNTFFSLTFHIDSDTYRYSIVYDNVKRIIKDEKLEYFDKNFYVIFDKEQNIFNTLSVIEKERLNTYKLDKTTILYVLQNEVELVDKRLKLQINSVYNYLRKVSFDFISIQSDSSLKLLKKQKSFLNQIICKLKEFDLSIDTIKLNTREVSFDEYRRRFSFLENEDFKDFAELVKFNYEREKTEYDFKIIHKNKGIEFSEESAGTQQIMNILFSLYASNKKIWIIDDFENFLHEEAATQLIIYLASNLLDMQFILMAHELSFLNLPEIHNKAVHYFVTKDENDLSTTIVNLTQFSDLRSDERNNWELFYRSFRLGQYPIITINDQRKQNAK